MAAGMRVSADELCTSERNMIGAKVCRDPSLLGMQHTISERNRRAGHSPTFVDNRHRVNHILEIMERNGISGVVYHVLKGCHPYDIESINCETKIKERGYHFLKIETDFSPEDRQNISMRLEAFQKGRDALSDAYNRYI